METGYKTSGFWLSLLAVFVGHILQSQVIHDSLSLKILGTVSEVLATAGYTWSRSALKINAIDGSDLKPGWKSSEFFLSALSFLLSAVTGSGALATDPMMQILSLIQANVIPTIYSLFRHRVHVAQVLDAKDRKEREGQSVRTVIQ